MGVVAPYCTLTRSALVADRHEGRPELPRHVPLPQMSTQDAALGNPRLRVTVRNMYTGRFTDGSDGLH
jgi:hypothetical protein